MNAKKQRRCDACGKRIHARHHELRLREALTGQAIGLYHARPHCQAAAAKYFTPGVVATDAATIGFLTSRGYSPGSETHNLHAPLDNPTTR